MPLLDAFGRPFASRSVLSEELAGPSLTGVRSPLTGYPADGLTPDRLAAILRDADRGDPVRYLELAETIEERDPHYLGVLGTRKRSVSQIGVTVDAASDEARDVEIADAVREWLTRDTLADELVDMLDALGKGYSFTEVIWDSSEGQWRPARLEWRDPRWFRFARGDLSTPLLLDPHGAETPLPGGKFIFMPMKAKSGLSLRGGLARVAAWAWMFKAFTQRDWAIFTQTYGQPVRLGKYGAGATDADKETLFRAVANIAADCAAIIPQSMMIEFVEAKSISGSLDLYERRSDWLDRQVSKAVLGQTTTTDAVSGGHAVAREHRLVQEDIERSDAVTLAATLNRDLIRVWVDLEWGPQKRYPRLRIARPDARDLKELADALAKLVPLGLRAQASEVRDLFGLADPDEGAELLGAPAAVAPPAPPPQPAPLPPAPQSALPPASAPGATPEQTLPGLSLALSAPGMDATAARLRALVAGASSPEEAEAKLRAAAAETGAPAALVESLRAAMLMAWLTGLDAAAGSGGRG